MVILQRSAIVGPLSWRKMGPDSTEELVQLQHDKERVGPTLFHGGLIFGRDCRKVGNHSDVACATLKGEASQDHLHAAERAWSFWNMVRMTLNRVVIVSADEEARFRADTAAMVKLLKCSFPPLSVSSKLHILMFHAPDILELY